MLNVEDFLGKLAEQTASKKTIDFKKKGRQIEKISLNFEGNFGRYQLFPLNDVVIDYPFVKLPQTMEVCIPRKIMSPDGTESVINSWIRLLPADGYKMKDQTGRVVSSLTAEDERILSEARNLFDQLFQEVDARNNIDTTRNFIRKRNYTIFNAYCLNRWSIEDSRNPSRSNFSGLFVCTASGLVEAVRNNIEEKTLMTGEGPEIWLNSVYSDKLTGRDGFIMLSISRSKSTAGYNVTVTHEYGRANVLSNYRIPEEDAELMKHPVEQFLGWQAAREDESVAPEHRRLFNQSLIKEAANFMSNQLAAIRTAKANGTDINEAIQNTNNLILSQQTPKTMDPMLKDDSSNNGVNAEKVVANNTEPFKTPAASHLDPITSAPTGNNSSFGGFGGNNFSSPGFANWGGGSTENKEGDLPF